MTTRPITNPAYLRHIRRGGNWASYIATVKIESTESAKTNNPSNNCCDTDHYRDAVARLQEMKKERGLV